MYSSVSSVYGKLAYTKANRVSGSAKDRVLMELETLLGCRPDPRWITDSGTERCVVCHKDTGVSALDDVETRNLYVQGVGQHCSTCY
ncbi:MAG: hypothetical protein ACR2PA_18640 [Hyphomicrobiaceae bacterium]